MALELGLFRIENHFLTILIRFELFDLAGVIGGALWELHAHTGCHDHVLVLFARHKHLLSRLQILVIHIVAKTASYRVCPRTN